MLWFCPVDSQLIQCTEKSFLLQPTAVVTAAVLLMRSDSDYSALVLVICYLNCPVSNRCWRTLEHRGKFMFCYPNPSGLDWNDDCWICSTALKHEDNLPSDLHHVLPEHWQFRKHTHILCPAGFLTMLDPRCKLRRCRSPPPNSLTIDRLLWKWVWAGWSAAGL